MSTSFSSSKRILANLFELLSKQKKCAEWWFGLNTNENDLYNKNKVEQTRAHNKYSLYELLGISNSDWNLFLLDCKIFIKRGGKFQINKNNLDLFKSECKLQFISTYYSKNTS